MKDLIQIDWEWVETEFRKRERIGAAAGTNGSGYIVETAAQCLETARRMVHPRLVRGEQAVKRIRSGSVELGDGTVFTGKRLASYVKGATRVEAYLVTVGDGCEREASRLMSEGDTLHGYLLDRISSFAVESLAEDVERVTRDRCAENAESVSMRLSPGYCDWPIEEQFALARVIDFTEAGVQLTEHCMMLPRKSISAILAVGPRGVFAKSHSQCAACDMTDCSYRRV